MSTGSAWMRSSMGAAAPCRAFAGGQPSPPEPSWFSQACMGDTWSGEVSSHSEATPRGLRPASVRVLRATGGFPPRSG